MTKFEDGVEIRSIDGTDNIFLKYVNLLCQEWYPAVTAGVLTSVFLLLWYNDPSCLTLLALLGLLATILDYAVPRLQDKIFPETAWTGDKERRLDQFCQNMVSRYRYQCCRSVTVSFLYGSGSRI